MNKIEEYVDYLKKQEQADEVVMTAFLERQNGPHSIDGRPALVLDLRDIRVLKYNKYGTRVCFGRPEVDIIINIDYHTLDKALDRWKKKEEKKLKALLRKY